MTPLNIAIMVIYFVVLSGMGWYFARRQKGTEDYFRAQGRIPWWAAGLSLVGTGLSAITYMGVPAKSYMTDWGMFLLNFGTFWIAPLIIWFYIPTFRRMNLTSVYEYLEKRFNLAARLFGSAFFMIFQLGRMAIVLFLPSLALAAATDINIYFCIVIMGVVSLVYTFVGGIEAVIWTDVLQVIILMGGALFALGYMIFQTPDGVSGLIATGIADNKFHMVDSSFNFVNPTIWVILLSSVFTYLTTYSADQTMVQRYFVTKDEKDAVRGVWTNAIIAIPTTLIFFLMGTALYVFYKYNPDRLVGVPADNDAIFPWFIVKELPDGISGLLIVGIFAASMSSLSSSMNSISSAWTVDFHERLFHGRKETKLKLAKAVTLLSGTAGIALALLMATWNVNSLWDEYNRLIGLAISSLGGLFFLGVMTKRANAHGALIGVAVSIVVQWYIGKNELVHLLLYSTTGFVSCVVAGYLASFLFAKKESYSDESQDN
ncbi:MAG: sodium:solute symporter [Planctomycetia bacterium]|nr:sodium:solute symporter [Planctomycetia bacterium]